VLATVACGLYLASASMMAADTRAERYGTRSCSLNGLVFVLIGLAARGSWRACRGRCSTRGAGGAVCGSVIVVRFVWTFATDWWLTCAARARHSHRLA
jgi:NhaP-type Na+/H+ or K+/H+ antiporter